MMGELDIRVADPAWTGRIPGIRSLCRRAATAALEELGTEVSTAGISVLLTDDDDLSTLNARWRGVHRPTNVLSFSPVSKRASASDPVSGDIALAFGTIAREAESGGVRIEDHLAHLLVHGILHLSGHDHRHDGEAGRMEAAEAGALARIGIADPRHARVALEAAS